MKTRITELLDISYPCLQGGMAWIADSALAAAVSAAGGLGIIAAGNAPADVVREEICRTRALTDRPFGVNIMLMSPYADDIAALVLEEKVPVVTTGAGSPARFIPQWKEAGIKVIPVIASAAHAMRMERAGADAVVAEGCEAGGHIGELTTMALVPMVCDAVSVPVLAAGGIADGRGVAAAMMLGASGVQMGTRFLAASECTVHPAYQRMVVEAGDVSTVVTGRSTGHPVRVIKNAMTREFAALEKNSAPPEELEAFLAGSLQRAARAGDVKSGSVMAGQSAGLVHSVMPCAEILREVFDDAKELLTKGAV